MNRSNRRQLVAGILDRLIEFSKWPTGLVCLLMLPTTVWASFLLILKIVRPTPEFIAFSLGVVTYVVVARWLERIRIFGTFFSTLEHELTHGLVATLTFHRVLSIRSTWRSGGHITIEGQGNWWITLSPYFLPTVSLLLLPMIVISPWPVRWGVLGLQGVSWAYHVWSTIRETHRHQSDIKKVGWLFAFIFLPTANLVTMMGVLAFASDGIERCRDFLVDCLPWFLLTAAGH
ncbi:MAG TPA: hypothetical protein EYG57_09020 [Planctomycetes bacterium]|nr:hypothetical protein [Planctomycetaceae bacterium]HIM29687.1 hypothetical protein [Planctomycetota bacterium]